MQRHRAPAGKAVAPILTAVRRQEMVAWVAGLSGDLGEHARGVLYSLGGFSGGLALYVKDGILSCKHNLFEINRTHIRASKKLKPGPAKIEITTRYEELKPAGPLKVLIKVDGKEVASGVVPISAPLVLPPMIASILEPI